MDQLKAVIANDARHGFPPDLVEAAKRREIMELELKKNSIPELAETWSQALAVEGRNSPEDDIAAMSRVTAADVDRVAREYLRLDRAVFAILTPEASGRPTPGKGFGGAESFAPEHPGAVKPPDWARQALESPSVPVSRVQPDRRDPAERTAADHPAGLRERHRKPVRARANRAGDAGAQRQGGCRTGSGAVLRLWHQDAGSTRVPARPRRDRRGRIGRGQLFGTDPGGAYRPWRGAARGPRAASGLQPERLRDRPEPRSPGRSPGSWRARHT